MDTADAHAREREEQERAADREPTVIELMNGPQRPSDARRKAVLWVGLAFAAFMIFVTAVVIGSSGPDFLSLTTMAMLLILAAAMIGALRYKGEDPMEPFEPHDDLRPGRRRRKKS